MMDPYETKIVLDGNDGTGKTSLAAKLKALGFRNVVDRGIPTKMTDDPKLRPGPEHAGEVYCLLDAPVDVCRARLGAAGKDLTEQYHTVSDLTYYRQRYRDVAAVLGVELIDSTGTPEETLARVMYFLGGKWAEQNAPKAKQEATPPKGVYLQGAKVHACDECSSYVCPCIVKRLGAYEAAVKWYAWPDHYVPRYEGVGNAGAGAKFYSNVESDGGLLAQRALGVQNDPEYAASSRGTEELLAKIRASIPATLFNATEASRAEREGRCTKPAFGERPSSETCGERRPCPHHEPGGA